MSSIHSVFPPLALHANPLDGDAKRFLAANVDLVIALSTAELSESTLRALDEDRWTREFPIHRLETGHLIFVPREGLEGSPLAAEARDLICLMRACRAAGATYLRLDRDASRLPEAYRMQLGLEAAENAPEGVIGADELGFILQTLQSGPLSDGCRAALAAYLQPAVPEIDGPLLRKRLLNELLADPVLGEGAEVQLSQCRALLVDLLSKATTVGDLCDQELTCLFHPEVRDLKMDVYVGDAVARLILVTALNLATLRDAVVIDGSDIARPEGFGLRQSVWAATAVQAGCWLFG